MLSLTLHRVTGSKESVNYLHKLGHGISHDKVSAINNTWSKSRTKVRNSFINKVHKVTPQLTIMMVVKSQELPTTRIAHCFNVEEENTNLLEECIQKDTAWSVANGLLSNAGEHIPLLGSWTVFNRSVARKVNYRIHAGSTTTKVWRVQEVLR